MLIRGSILLLLVACGTRPPTPDGDGGTAPPDDGGLPGEDAGALADAGTHQTDAGEHDAGAPTDAGASDAGASDAGFVDRDGDGLDDAYEAQLAADYLPSLSLHPQDDCPLGLILYRARPHPADPSLVMILYDHLYERDCGLGSHTGDNEAFAITVNPAKPAPAGITAMKAIAHQATLCQKVTTCGTCDGLPACDTNAEGRPRRYASRNKHGGYVQKSVCTLIAICPDDCAAGEQLGVPLANAGEPGAPFLDDLTEAGLITADAGWTRAELFHFDPWGPVDFGGAGNVADDLVDPAFDTAPCP